MAAGRSGDEITSLYRDALQQFVEKIRQDDQVIAAVLLGSLSYDQVWEKSDIDLKLIVHDQKLNTGYTCFVENDVPINTSINTRNDFKRWVERSVGGSIDQSMLVRSTLLFTKDESIAEYFEQIRYIGERDRQLQLQGVGGYTLHLLAKAEKWLYVKDDAAYSAYWILRIVEALSKIEVLLHGEVPMRESIRQAMAYNPALFQALYTDLLEGEATALLVRSALELINEYLDERAEKLFRPILSYLEEEGEMRTVTDIVDKFSKVTHMDAGSAVAICDWLAERGLIAKLESETKAAPKSRIMLLEPAYLYENMEWEL